MYLLMINYIQGDLMNKQEAKKSLASDMFEIAVEAIKKQEEAANFVVDQHLYPGVISRITEEACDGRFEMDYNLHIDLSGPAGTALIKRLRSEGFIVTALSGNERTISYKISWDLNAPKVERNG